MNKSIGDFILFLHSNTFLFLSRKPSLLKFNKPKASEANASTPD